VFFSSSLGGFCGLGKLSLVEEEGSFTLNCYSSICVRNIRHPHHMWRGKVGKITPWDGLMSSFWSSAWQENPWENRKLRWRFGVNVSTSFLVHYVPLNLKVVLSLSSALSCLRIFFYESRGCEAILISVKNLLLRD
jgi:hypothetical protein